MAVTYTIQGRLDGLNAYVNACRTNPYKWAKCKRSNQKICRCSIPYELREKDREIRFPVCVEITWYEKDRRRDPDNIASAKKYILDSLVEAGVFPDDGWKYILSFADYFQIDSKNPRIEVTIYENKEADINEFIERCKQAILKIRLQR